MDHRLKRLRFLRALGHVVRFLVWLARLSKAVHTLRDGLSRGKRRLSPSPDEQDDPLLCMHSCDSSGALEPPERMHRGWVRRVLSRVGFGDG